VNDVALLAYSDGNQNLHALDTTTDAYVRALEIILAEFRRQVEKPRTPAWFKAG
jgi:hypothetical protein